MAGQFQNYHFGCRNTTKYDSLYFIHCIETAIKMTFRRAGPPCRTPKCHYYCSFNTDYEIERIVLTCNSAAKILNPKFVRHDTHLNVIITAMLIQTVQIIGNVNFQYCYNPAAKLLKPKMCPATSRSVRSGGVSP